MYKRLSTLFAVLTYISSGVANADSVASAYASYTDVDKVEEPELFKDNMDHVLNKNLYEIQQTTSNMKFRVDSPIGDIWVNIDDFEGSFTMQDNGIRCNLAAIEVNTDSMETDRGLIGMILRGEDFLDVKNFPSMRFIGSSFEWFSEKHAVLKGYMTIKNVTRLIAFYVVKVDHTVENIYSERITMEATASIKRSEFGIYTLLPLVSDDVSLYIRITAEKKNTSISSKHTSK